MLIQQVMYPARVHGRSNFLVVRCEDIPSTKSKHCPSVTSLCKRHKVAAHKEGWAVQCDQAKPIALAALIPCSQTYSSAFAPAWEHSTPSTPVVVKCLLIKAVVSASICPHLDRGQLSHCVHCACILQGNPHHQRRPWWCD